VVDGAQLTQHARVVWHQACQHLQPADGSSTVARHVCRQRQAVHHLQACVCTGSSVMQVGARFELANMS
jgi:hypothetical protein